MKFQFHYLSCTSNNRRGWTLIELIVVIAILGALVAMAIPGIQQVREAARRTTCSNNVRQLALAAHQYESAHQYFPPGVLASPIPGRTAGFQPRQDGIHKPSYIGTKVFLLPFLEQQALDSQFATNRDPKTGDRDAWWKFPQPLGSQILDAASVQLPIFLCPTDRSHKHAESMYMFVHAYDTQVRRGRTVGMEYLARTNYMSCAGALGAAEQEQFDQYWHAFTGVFHNRSRTAFGHITDGSSNVIAFGETASNTLARDGRPADYSWVCDGMPTAWGIYGGQGEGGQYYQFKSKHSDHVVSAAMVDGSTRFVSAAIELTTLYQLSGKSDGWPILD